MLAIETLKDHYSALTKLKYELLHQEDNNRPDSEELAACRDNTLNYIKNWKIGGDLLHGDDDEIVNQFLASTTNHGLKEHASNTELFRYSRLLHHTVAYWEETDSYPYKNTTTPFLSLCSQLDIKDCSKHDGYYSLGNLFEVSIFASTSSEVLEVLAKVKADINLVDKSSSATLS